MLFLQYLYLLLADPRQSLLPIIHQSVSCLVPICYFCYLSTSLKIQPSIPEYETSSSSLIPCSLPPTPPPYIWPSAASHMTNHKLTHSLNLPHRGPSTTAPIDFGRLTEGLQTPHRWMAFGHLTDGLQPPHKKPLPTLQMAFIHLIDILCQFHEWPLVTPPKIEQETVSIKHFCALVFKQKR